MLTNSVLERGVLLCQHNSGPEKLPRRDKYDSKVETGQISLLVHPITTLTPFLNWFVLYCLMFREMTLGDTELSAAIPESERWTLGSYCFSFSTMISPDLQNIKNVATVVAHSIKSSYNGLPLNQVEFNSRRMEGVIRRWRRVDFPNLAVWNLIPFRTWWSLGIWSIRGSGKTTSITYLLNTQQIGSNSRCW